MEQKKKKEKFLVFMIIAFETNGNIFQTTFSQSDEKNDESSLMHILQESGTL